MMKISIKNLVGKLVPLDVEPSDTIRGIKEILQPLEGIHPDQLSFLFKGKRLEDGKTLDEYNIQMNDKIYMIVELKGGYMNKK